MGAQPFIRIVAEGLCDSVVVMRVLYKQSHGTVSC